MSYTTDRNDSELTRGVDTEETPQAKKYLILSEEERAKGFVRPVRDTYTHVGAGPKHPLRDLTEEEKVRVKDCVKFEVYPESRRPALGRYWTQAELDYKGCGGATTMTRPLAETYAREPGFYGATYCAHCRKHLPVAEFVWGDGSVVGS